MRVLVMNLTRMGDILESVPVLKALKRKFSEVHLLVNKEFAGITQFIPYCDFIHTFERLDFVTSLSRLNALFPRFYKYYSDFVKEVNKRDYDLLINFVPEAVSALLANMIKAKEKRGAIYKKGDVFCIDNWTRFLMNAVLNRKFNPFNLTDILAGISDVEAEIDAELRVKEEKEKEAVEILYKNRVKEGDILIGFQPGASRPEKIWMPHYFAQVAKHFQNRAKIILFGVEKEKPLGEAIKKRAQVIDLIGKTDLGLLISILKRCKILLTNDTGTMHIASRVGVPCLTLCMGTARSYETAPYSADNIVVEPAIPCYPCHPDTNCKSFACKYKIKPEIIIEIMEKMLKKEKIEARWKGVRVYVTRHKDGLLHLLPLHKKTLYDFYNEVYMFTWRKILSGNFEEKVSFDTNFDKPFVEEKMGLYHLHNLSVEGEKICDYLLSSILRSKRLKFEEVEGKIKKVSEGILNLRRNYFLRPIIDAFLLEQDDKGDVVSLSLRLRHSFRFLRFVSVLTYKYLVERGRYVCEIW